MKTTVISVLLVSVIMLCGCDSFRKLAGRPTSDEIATKKAELERIEQSAQAVVEESVKDSVEVVETPVPDETFDGKTMELKRVGGLANPGLQGRLHIIIGSFADAANAEKLSEKAKAAGYDAQVIAFRNGYNAVSAGNAQTYSVLNPLMAKLRQEPFCPSDAWVLINE